MQESLQLSQSSSALPFGPLSRNAGLDNSHAQGVGSRQGSGWSRADLEAQQTGLQQWAMTLQATAARHAALQSRLQQRVHQVWLAINEGESMRSLANGSLYP